MCPERLTLLNLEVPAVAKKKQTCAQVTMQFDYRECDGHGAS
jgi:hypothetical protein